MQKHILKRQYSLTLKETLNGMIPQKRTEFSQLKSQLKDTPITPPITIGSILGGMRGLPLMYWQSSTLDPEKGIRFHGYTIKQCQEKLPGPKRHHSSCSSKDKEIFYPEAMFWLLMTGEIPTWEQTTALTRQWNDIVTRHSDGHGTSYLPSKVNQLIDSLPHDMHPMTQFALGVASLSHYSKFRHNYSQDNIPNKMSYWEDVFDDVMMTLAFLPLMAGKIYRRVERLNDTTRTPHFNPEDDWSLHLTKQMGLSRGRNNNNNDDATDLIRLYMGLHVDHEGGNVSSHTTHLVGSSLSDPMLSYSAGVLGLAGPLHGLAAQNVLKFLNKLRGALSGGPLSESAVSGSSAERISVQEQEIKQYLSRKLETGHIIPGYGHAVLRQEDPRFTALRQFIERRHSQFKDDDLCQLMLCVSRITPQVLLQNGKVSNPYPNVDCATGVLFNHYGMKQMDFITVIFAVSRAMGPLAQLVWDRIYGLPIERPKSVDLNMLRQYLN